MGQSYILRAIIFLLILMLGLFARAEIDAEIDIDEQIRRAEDPHYDQYLVDTVREHQQEIKAAEQELRHREREIVEEEKVRSAYVEWKHHQKEPDNEHDELAFLKAQEHLEDAYLLEEQRYAVYLHEQEQKQIAYQNHLLQKNRMPASLTSPRVLRSKRLFKDGLKTEFKKKDSKIISTQGVSTNNPLPPQPPVQDPQALDQQDRVPQSVRALRPPPPGTKFTRTPNSQPGVPVLPPPPIRH